MAFYRRIKIENHNDVVMQGHSQPIGISTTNIRIDAPGPLLGAALPVRLCGPIALSQPGYDAPCHVFGFMNIK